MATGATLEVEPLTLPYSEFEADDELRQLYRNNAETLGRSFGPTRPSPAGSTDMANISLMMPTIHPMLGLDSFPAVNHQPEFTDFCKTSVADQATIEGAVAMAQTAVDAATTDSTRARLLDADTIYSGRSDYPWRF